MGSQGSCLVCSRSDRELLDNEHARGAQTRGLSRAYGIPEATLRRHFHRCGRVARRPAQPVARPAAPAAPAAAEVVKAEVGILTIESLIEVAEQYGLEAEHVVSHALWMGRPILVMCPDDARVLADAVALGLDHFDAA